MTSLESRVTTVPTVPHYPTLAKALQSDMQEATHHIASAYKWLRHWQKWGYSIPPEAVKDCELALIALDRPDLVVPEDIDDLLLSEYLRLKTLTFKDLIVGYRFNRSVQQFVDVEAELMRRNFFTKDGE